MWLRVVQGLLVGLLLTSAALAAPEQSPRLRVGFAQDTLANDWRAAQVADLKREFAQHPQVDLLVTDGQGSTARQISDIEDLIHQGIDILIVSPRDAQAMTPVIGRVFRQGMPVVLLTRHIESDQYTTFIAPDDDGIARAAARHIAAELKGRGQVLVLQGVPTASTAQVRTAAFLDELESWPQLRVSAVKVGNYLRSDAIVAVEEALEEGVAFEAIYAQSDSMASGARIALGGAGRDPREVVIVGIDYIAEARAAIRKGEQSASFTYPTCAREAVASVLAIAAGRQVPHHQVVASRKVTRDNVEQVEPIF